MQPEFELLIASRYLRADRPPGSIHRLRWATFGLILVTAAIYGGDRLIEYYMRDHLSELLWDLRNGTWELFDLARDPRETRDLAAAQPERADGLRRQLDAWMGGLVPQVQ